MIRSRLCGVVVALAIGVAGLSACSSSEPATAPADPTTATSAPPESSAPETSTAPSASSDAGNGAKPSKEEIVKGYSKIVKGVSADLPDDLVKKVTSCFVDEVYDKASVKTLRAIASGDASGIDSGDATLFVDAQAACQKKLVG